VVRHETRGIIQYMYSITVVFFQARLCRAAKTIEDSPPKYRQHKARDLAVVTINRRDHYLGPYGSPESYNEYARLIAEWRQGLLGEAVSTTRPNESIRIAELTLSYWTHCQTYYHHEDGSNGRLSMVRAALKAVNACFANEKTSDFGPLKLQTVRQTLIVRDLSRNYINGLIAVFCQSWLAASRCNDEIRLPSARLQPTFRIFAAISGNNSSTSIPNGSIPYSSRL